MAPQKPAVTILGQTPPPWHGQAVATQILFDHDWPGFDAEFIRMDYSSDMEEVGRFQLKKIGRLLNLIIQTRRSLCRSPNTILLYPPASAKWVPFLRDIIFLSCVRPFAGGTVFIFHASGLPVFAQRNRLTRLLAKHAYGGADVALEVALEAVTPHEVFGARNWSWCPCAIEVPAIARPPLQPGAPFTALFVGSLQEGKGVLEILRTAAELKARGREADFRFRVVGKWFSEDFRKEALECRSQLGVEGMVDFPGQITGDEKWRTYGTADVFFFPSHYASEATPIVLMEALGAGLPILSTQWAGIPAMLDGCGSAVLLPVRSPSLYADALLDFHKGWNRDSGGVEAAREFYRGNFLPERFVGRVREAFEIVLANQGSGRLPCAEETPGTGGQAAPVIISAYLADQNPGYDRSFGISRMTLVVLNALRKKAGIGIEAIVSRTSQQAPGAIGSVRRLPWGTRNKFIRLLTDHIHPLCSQNGPPADVYYYPKGYLPLLSEFCHPSVVTIHDTIIQYDEDHYPKWRKPAEYAYWAMMLKHTLREADAIMTVSKTSERQIRSFMDRHGIPPKEIAVTYEPCLYESLPQPPPVEKSGYVIHLASTEPHKQTATLVRWWVAAQRQGRDLPILHLIGNVPKEVQPMLDDSSGIVRRPFLDDSELQEAYRNARALILPSEIEGFGLPALEAYYLGTPVCFVRGTSVEEVLAPATAKGVFSLENPDSLFAALEQVTAMDPEEIRNCGLKLRETYAAEKVADRMLAVFMKLAGRGE